MPSKPLISVGQLIDQSWDIFRGRLVELLSVSGWVLVTAILYAIALSFYPSATKLGLGGDLSNMEFIGVILFALNTFIISPIITFWVYISLTRMVRAHLARRSVDHASAIKEGRQAFIPALITTIMVLLMLVLAIVIGFGPPAIIAGIGAWFSVSGLIFVGNLLLIFGLFLALYLSVQWMVYYFFAPIATINDNLKGRQALEASRRLVAGKFWEVLARIIVPKLVFLSFGVFAMTMFSYVATFFVDASGGLNLDLQLRLTTMTNTIIPIMIVVLINPLIIISDVLLYQSLKDNRS
ncbi:hypothetical protein CO174_05005 [Candidatus Uhrbacteria bacterium CG_4_9_14_3_um_filter_50_9]|uniref:Glycerophosphoryl diester phosphodiesterase membrane domain-containing protein n=1 Tax=Candidatus Uhrbacteria bacterium CG_4_9_14_3_um_filter_50_9 TaxID=1975035 RepID=A0A2M7XBF0_9BACT|nr:MAG: hypothetical protein CO174_05005 [Candidatus Uhrbacteria bacterium CG_4_9_14_3_um_filter_50_9]